MTIEPPTENVAAVVPQAVAAYWRRHRPRVGEVYAPEDAAKAQVAGLALRTYLDVGPEDLPGAVVQLLDHAQSRIYYTRDGTEENAAWRTLFSVVNAVLEPDE